MGRFSIPYGKKCLEFSLPDAWKTEVLRPRHGKSLANPRKEAESSLNMLDGLFNADDGRRRVAVAINDKTRPVPHKVLLPALIDKLEQWGFARKDITLLIATGSHPPMPPEEFPIVVPEGVTGCRIVSHDADNPANLIFLGTTSLGTPCLINRIFAEADLRIVVGNIEPHQFMGWSGGMKSAAIGLAARETISANHSRMDMDGTGPCRFDNNPVRQDVIEMGRMVGVHLAMNVVMNEAKEIVAVFAGNPAEVMRRGISVASEIFNVDADVPADLVIAGGGGAPKDINLYQAQKALRHGTMAGKPNAPLIVVAECSDGIGSASFEKWMANKKSFTEVREAFAAEGFRVGPHKAVLFAEDVKDRRVILVSDLPDDTVRGLLLESAPSINDAVDRLIRDGFLSATDDQLRVVIMPSAATTVPLF